MGKYKGPRVTTLTQAMITKVLNKHGEYNDLRKMKDCTCNKCGKELKLGDSIFTKRSSVFRWYHEECAKQVNLI